mmetsp:Transcript_32024/g.57415  ORF Transcript_32024/g.57415 Transcript_32024/m.57415 type:complete len:210 (-) Transcript_32024:6097-6726(-)
MSNCRRSRSPFCFLVAMTSISSASFSIAGWATFSSPSVLNHSADWRLFRSAESRRVLVANMASAPTPSSPRSFAFLLRCAESAGAPAIVSKVLSTVRAIIFPWLPTTSGRAAKCPRSMAKHLAEATKSLSCLEQKHATTAGTTITSKGNAKEDAETSVALARPRSAWRSSRSPRTPRAPARACESKDPAFWPKAPVAPRPPALPLAAPS